MDMEFASKDCLFRASFTAMEELDVCNRRLLVLKFFMMRISLGEADLVCPKASDTSALGMPIVFRLVSVVHKHQRIVARKSIGETLEELTIIRTSHEADSQMSEHKFQTSGGSCRMIQEPEAVLLRGMGRDAETIW